MHCHDLRGKFEDIKVEEDRVALCPAGPATLRGPLLIVPFSAKNRPSELAATTHREKMNRPCALEANPGSHSRRQVP